MLLKSCSVPENGIEWNFYTFLIHNLSPYVLLSNQIAVFIDQLEIYKDLSFSHSQFDSQIPRKRSLICLISHIKQNYTKC